VRHEAAGINDKRWHPSSAIGAYGRSRRILTRSDEPARCGKRHHSDLLRGHGRSCGQGPAVVAGPLPKNGRPPRGYVWE
jgi:hypothetical protein